MRMIDSLLSFPKEIRLAVRSLVKAPGYSLVVILTLALGIGANTAVFTLVEGVLLARSPFAEPERLVALGRTTPSNLAESFSPGDLVELRQQANSLEAAAAWDVGTVNLTGKGEPERLQGGDASSNFFALLGIAPQIGRPFSAADEVPGSEPVAMLSHAFWMRRFSGAQDAVGQQVVLDGVPTTVVGVLPESFRYRPAGAVDLWRVPPYGIPKPPFEVDGDVREMRGLNYFSIVGRLAPGVELSRANAELEAVSQRWAEEDPENFANQTLNAKPLREKLVADLRSGLWTLMAAVAAVLLIACINVAGLALARVLGQRREIALRAALGAGRADLARGVLAEGLLLALAGGGLGVLLAVWGRDLLLTLAPTGLAEAARFDLDGRVLLFSVAATLGSLLLCAAIPALLATRPKIEESLRQGDARGTSGRSASRLRAGLVVAETALALMLLVGAGLLVRSLMTLTAVDPGFDPDGVLALSVQLPDSSYPEDAQISGYFDRARQEIAALPGVESVSQTFSIPFAGGKAILNFAVEGQPPAVPGEEPEAGYQVVAPGFFETLRIPILQGTGLPASADLESMDVAVVSESMAREFLLEGDPVGQRFTFGDPANENWVQIVGVAADVRHDGYDKPQRAMIYISSRQATWPWGTFLVRASGPPASHAAAARRALYAIDPDIPVYKVQPFSDYLGASVSDRRFLTLLLGFFAAVAAALAALGIYGVVAYSVAQRRREIGIRMALGARRERVVRAVVGGGLRLTLLGMVLGVAAAVALSRFLAGHLFGIGVNDPPSYAFGALMLVLVAVAACWLPARRAAGIDPAVTLRSD